MITIPWTDEQVAALNGFQRANVFHPFTCEYRSDHNMADGGILIATTGGFVCPYPSCEYTQHWAHELMADPHWIECRGGIYHTMANVKGVSEYDL